MRHELEEGGRRVDTNNLTCGTHLATHAAAGYGASHQPPISIAAPNTLIFPALAPASHGAFRSGKPKLPQPLTLRCIMSDEAELSKVAEMPGTHAVSDAAIASGAGESGGGCRLSSDCETRTSLHSWWQLQGQSSGYMPLHPSNLAAVEAAPPAASRPDASSAGNVGGPATTKIAAVTAAASQPLIAKLLIKSGGGSGDAHGVPMMARPPVVQPQGVNFQPDNDSSCAQSFLLWRGQLAASAPPLVPSPLPPWQEGQQQHPQQQQEQQQQQSWLQLSNMQQSLEPSLQQSAKPSLHNHLAAKQIFLPQPQQQQHQQVLLLQQQPQRQLHHVRVTPETSAPGVPLDHGRSLGDAPSLADDGAASDCGSQLVLRGAGQDDGVDVSRGELVGCNIQLPPPGRPDAVQSLPVPYHHDPIQMQVQVQTQADQRNDPTPVPTAPPPSLLPPQHPPQHQPQQNSTGTGNPAPSFTVLRCVSCGFKFNEQPGQLNGFFARDSRTYTCNSCCLRNKKETGFYGPPGTRSLEEAGGRACEECGATEEKEWYGHWTKTGAYACTSCFTRLQGPRDPCQQSAAGQAQAQQQSRERMRKDNDGKEREEEEAGQLKEEVKERKMEDDEQGEQQKEAHKDQVVCGTAAVQECNGKLIQRDVPQAKSAAERVPASPPPPQHLTPPSPPHSLKHKPPLLRQRLTSCPPPRAAALLAVARIAGHGASQTVAGKAADGVGGGGRDGDIAGGDGVGSGPSGSVKRTRHKSSSATGSIGGNHGTHRAADSKQASSGRQQEQHKHGRDGPAADDSVPRCACGVVYRDRPGQPNGFFARDSRTYTCNSCCLRNKKETGFYGPPGTRSLEEAGGRACEECGTTETNKWHPHKHTRGAYVCSRCDGHFVRRGTYSRIAGGADGKGAKGCDPRVTSAPANNGGGGSGGGCFKELATQEHWPVAAGRKRRVREAPAMLGSSTTSASTTTSTTTSENSSRVTTSSNASSAEEEENAVLCMPRRQTESATPRPKRRWPGGNQDSRRAGLAAAGRKSEGCGLQGVTAMTRTDLHILGLRQKRQRLVSLVEATGTIADGVVTKDWGSGVAADSVDGSGSADGANLPDGQLVRQWIQVLKDKVTALCVALARGPETAAGDSGPPGNTAGTSVRGGSGAKNGQDEAHPRQEGDPEAVTRVTGGSNQSSGALRLGDLIYRWMKVHIWPRPLALMLGPAAAALALDREGPIPGLNEEEQATWDLSRADVCEGFVDVADAAMGERPREPVTDAGIRRFREVSSHLAEGLAAQLVLDQVAKQSAAAVPADPGTPEPGWPAVIADVITDVSMSDNARALARGPFRPLLLAVVAEGLRLALRLGMGAGGPGQLVARAQSGVSPGAGHGNMGSAFRPPARTGSPSRVVAPGVSWRRRHTARAAHQRAERSEVDVSALAIAVPSPLDVLEVQLVPALIAS